MKNMIFVALAALLLTACVTEKRCNRLYPPETIVIRKDSIIRTTETIYRDTTVYVHIPGETVTETKTVYLTEGVMWSDKSHLFTSFADTWAYVENGKLIHDLVQKDTLIQKTLDNAIRVTWVKAQQFYSREETKTVEVNKLTRWQKFYVVMGRIFFFSIIAALIYTVYMLRKFILSIID